MFRLLLILPLFALVACAQPKTQLPEVSKDEIEEEKAYQEQYLYEQDFSHIYDTPPTKRTMEKRLSRINKKIGPAAIQLCNHYRKQDKAGQKRRCLFHVELGPKDDDSYNAYADGHKLVISRKLIQLINKDDQLAFIIAHEFAHNIMGHLDDKKTNLTGGAILGAIFDVAAAGVGANTGGGFAKLGAQMGVLSFSPTYEHEADYVGLYIMARGGYNINNASNVWRMMSAVNPDSIYTSTTHPTSSKRFVMMKKTIEEIKEKRRAKTALLPEMKPQTQGNKS